ncbi:MAG: cob(I)yrinic acid a,c-diamide adenosyltransferase [Pseudomonadota bacterium]
MSGADDQGPEAPVGRSGRRITRVTTAGGDRGETSLADGSRISKLDPRIEAIGTVDELNSFVGNLILALEGQEPRRDNLVATSYEIQQSLFDLGGALAFPEGGRFPATDGLTAWVAELNDALPPLTEFGRPGGNAASVAAHLCRTVCRRAERCLWVLPPETEAGAQYLNRLSDYFFVLARTVNQQGQEKQWRGPEQD